MARREQTAKAQDLDHYAHAYFEARRKVGVRSVDEIESVYLRIVAPKFGAMDPHMVTPPKLNRLIEALANGKTPTLARRCKIIMSAIFNFARTHFDECGDLDNPTRPIRVANSKPRQIKLKPAQIGDLLAYFTRKAQALNLVACDVAIVCYLFTALRASELISLRRDQITDDGNALKALIPRTKNGSPHTVFFFGVAASWLECIAVNAAPRGYLFASLRNRGAPITRQKMIAHWREVQADLGLSGYTLHDLRRSSASLLASAGLPLSRVEMLLNHSTLNNVQAAYYQVHEAQLREIYAQLANILDDLRLAALEKPLISKGLQGEFVLD